ncbi:PAS domain S-box protein (plasmid) [Aliiroseovarius crassostreae]|uniref:cache domain-containing protein n=1 Tax=Aliiroseovarius crassostreae TaxID=154981 RepID=UPI002206D2EA|nr:cache domain-containing protein [Aliiroseovarius crassostreae]UWQ12749.1 PAS domain S-box protein [Aliiroseovarius crassostreae]
MERRHYSLRLVLAVALVGLQFIAVSAIIFFTFLSSERALLRQSHALLGEAGETVVSQVRSFLAPARQSLDVTRRLAENRVLDTTDDALLESHLFQQLLVAPQISGFYFAEPNGRFVYVMRSETEGRFRTKIIEPFDQSSPAHPAHYVWRNDQFEILGAAYDDNDTYEARTRPWFTQAKATQGSIWTDPYIYFTTRQPGITYAAPVLSEDGTLLGVLGIDIDINAISGFLAELWADKGGAAIIMNRNGEVVAHPELVLISNDSDMNHPTLTMVNQITDEVAKAAFGKLLFLSEDATSTSARELELQGKRFVSLLMPIPEPNLTWTVGIYAPVEAFIGEITKDRIRWIWVAGLVAVLTGLVGLRLADWINRPLRTFVKDTKQATRGGASLDDGLHSPYTELEGTGEMLVREIRTRQRYEAAYGRTFELTSRGMAQIEPISGNFLRVNDQLADLLGVSTAQLVTMSLYQFAPQEGNTPLENFSSILSEDTEFIEDICFSLPDGSTTWLRVNAILILDEFGQPDHAVAIFDDVNEQKKSADLTQQLSREMTHLSRVNLMGEMATGMAHELNQPLSAIAYNADALHLALSELGGDTEEVRQISADIERQAHRAGDIIRGLRDLVRKDRGRMVPFDMVALCSQTIKLVEGEARARSIQIEFAPGGQSDNPLNATGNRTQVAQVLVNLLRNAIDALAKDADPHAKITVSLSFKKGEVQTCVQDNGPGIPADFELFRKFDTIKSGGMGLGLSISRSIIEAHGGTIWHETPSQGGARFCFTLQTSPGTEETAHD